MGNEFKIPSGQMREIILKHTVVLVDSSLTLFHQMYDK